ncbi:MAG: hypothetical protein R8G34_01665 [Paracoccaceae bacterium]|nr:hypothetical protein [Paracoccaceae bacterium]
MEAISEPSEKPLQDDLRASALPDVFAGGGIGLLLGAALSLSLTPVIAGFISALTSMLAVLLSLDGSSSGKRMLRVNALRIGAFGFATVIGLTAGLYVRTSEPFKPTPAEVTRLWQEALPENPTLAKQIALYERAALQPATWAYIEGETGTEAAIDETRRLITASALQSSQTDTSSFDCSDLDPNIPGVNTVDAVAKYKAADAPELVRSLGAGIDSLSDPDKVRALEMAFDLVCLVQDKGALFPPRKDQ